MIQQKNLNIYYTLKYDSKSVCEKYQFVAYFMTDASLRNAMRSRTDALSFTVYKNAMNFISYYMQEETLLIIINKYL